jgi:CRISPR system Cascade subunit CasB
LQQPDSAARRFISRLEDLARKEERGPLAALRRGLGKKPGQAPEMYPYVVPWISERSSRGWEDALYLVAALFAWHPLVWHRVEGEYSANLGASLSLVARDTESESIEGRFVALLNAPSADLPVHLRHAIGLCKANEVPVDYVQLLGDLQHWEALERRVQRRWAAGFWAPERREEEKELAPSEPEGVEDVS